MLLRMLILTLMALIPLAFLWWGIRTCRSLWRHGSTAWGHLVYDKGVRGFGVFVSVGFVGIGARLGSTAFAESSGDTVQCAIYGAILGGIIGIPVALGMGYFWGAQMAWFLGLEPDADRPSAKRQRQKPTVN